jgi:hypothetical protein
MENEQINELGLVTSAKQLMGLLEETRDELQERVDLLVEIERLEGIAQSWPDMNEHEERRRLLSAIRALEEEGPIRTGMNELQERHMSIKPVRTTNSGIAL